MEPTRPRLLDRLMHRIEGVPGSDKLLLRLAFFAVIFTGIFFALSLNTENSELTAIRGGTISEGILGTPRFVNPTLALTRADQDVTALIYSGLMRINENGELVPDAAESVTVSEDGLTYTIVLRRDTTFHDGSPLTARDVAYTIGLIQDPDLKSPLRGNWTDVLVEEIGEYEINIYLEEAYAPFIENFTFGIMPAHLWSSLPTEQIPFSQLNTEPIGSGPFQVTGAERDTSGIISYYTLSAYRENGLSPKVDTFELRFYPNEDELLTALNEGLVDATAYLSPNRVEEALIDEFQLVEVPLPRNFGIFFNQNRSTALRDAAVREALTVALDRDALIENTLSGHGVPITGPTTFPLPELESEDDISTTTSSTSAERAVAILEDAGWEQNENGVWENEIDDAPVSLSLTLRTTNAPIFDALVQGVATQWQAIGVEVVVEQFEQASLVQSVIRTRDFQALLFGIDMNRTQDLYPFWHSSQQDDPGLNIAQYTNLTVDDLLEEARVEQDNTVREGQLAEASAIILEERPAIFILQPTLTYLIRTDVEPGTISNIGRPSDRFMTISDWHTESESLWPMFRSDL